jgi:hypothetical protein
MYGPITASFAKHMYLCTSNQMYICTYVLSCLTMCFFRPDLVEAMGIKDLNLTCGAVCVYPARFFFKCIGNRIKTSYFNYSD